MTDEIERADKALADSMDRRNRVFVQALRSHVGPNTFAWIERVTGHCWEAGPLVGQRAIGLQRAMQSAASKANALARSVTRDPCPVCGIRQDIGCAHRRIS